MLSLLCRIKNSKAKLLTSIALLLGLSACISIPSTDLIEISPDITFKLTAPPTALINTSYNQLVEITYSGQSKRFIAQLEYSSQQIALAAVSVSGMPLFDFVWQVGKPLKINQYVPLPGIDINYIVADMQWIHWPMERLKASLQGDHVMVEEFREISSDNWHRMISQGESIIYKVSKIKNIYHLEHMKRNYLIKITNLDLEEL